MIGPSPDLANMEQNAILKFSYDIWIVMFIIFAAVGTMLLNSNQPCFYKKNENSILIPFIILIILPLAAFTISFGIFVLNPVMRKSVFEEVKNYISLKFGFRKKY